MLLPQSTQLASVTTQIARSISCGSAESITRLKTTRGGQNLTDRHRRLEKSLRGREAQLKQIDDLSSPSTIEQPPFRAKNQTSDIFRGFVVPEQPKPPTPDECCMSGCAICVHDLFLDALATYDESVLSLRSSLAALNIPESEWPSRIRTSRVGSKEERPNNVSMDAFAALERALSEKKKTDSGNSS